MSDNSIACKNIQNKIRETIPQSDSMEFSITELTSDSIVVTAPLSKNYNIHGTGFAGSIYSLGILTGWALCYHTMEEFDMIGDLVVGKAEIRYNSPITEDIVCTTAFKSEQLTAFQDDFNKNGKSVTELSISIGDSQNAILKAHYFAKAT